MRARVPPIVALAVGFTLCGCATSRVSTLAGLPAPTRPPSLEPSATPDDTVGLLAVSGNALLTSMGGAASLSTGPAQTGGPSLVTGLVSTPPAPQGLTAPNGQPVTIPAATPAPVLGITAPVATATAALSPATVSVQMVTSVAGAVGSAPPAVISGPAASPPPAPPLVTLALPGTVPLSTLVGRLATALPGAPLPGRGP